ncbi:MAG: S8 family peptidase [Pseudomonadota bacterium]|nr:S8 family peptidase [Pseudomonadota bacterium]
MATAKSRKAADAASRSAITVMHVEGPDDGAARTVIYIHGIGNKPAEATLTSQWDRALFGQRMGDKTRMAYWVNRRRHGPPTQEESDDEDHSVSPSTMRQFAARSTDIDPDHEMLIQQLATGPEEEEFLRDVRDHVEANVTQASVGAKGATNVVWDGLSWLFTGAFLRDVHDFFFDPAERKRMKQSLMDVIAPGGAPFVVISHSQGTMIAYDVLSGLDPVKYPVKLFVTMGSPLGLGPVLSRFYKWNKTRTLRVPPGVERWLNVANRGDVVSMDVDLRDEVVGEGFSNEVVDSPNRALQDDKHSATGYLRVAAVQSALRTAVGAAFMQPIGGQVIASDLVHALEMRPRDAVHPVLIELAEATSSVGTDITVTRDKLVGRLQALMGDREDGESPPIEKLHHWVGADLTRREIEQLRTEFSGLDIRRIWRNAEKRALINQSGAIVQARPAHQAYDAVGRGIVWAVLDTGICVDHPHFAANKTVSAVWDCTRSGDAPVALDLAHDGAAMDPNGHGTHVAGIIAGMLTVQSDAKGEALCYAGMAPEAGLIGFKVLDGAGLGQDAWIIKALDKVAEINESAGKLVIHGLNLSLGGYFDPSVFGCGQTPLCRELRRLWRQGVLVVLAAGNEGYAELRTTGGSSWPSNMDISIGDPANLEEAIAVGSIHRTSPHTYGVSYFSSRGPTADGRFKPDLVAPGEKIRSARHDWASGSNGSSAPRGAPTQIDASSLYVEMSGTSMAAPHVSGLLAAFLSVRREFIGEPERVKQILLEHCVDLRRDHYVQGRGMPNLIRMLAAT